LIDVFSLLKYDLQEAPGGPLRIGLCKDVTCSSLKTNFVPQSSKFGICKSPTCSSGSDINESTFDKKGYALGKPKALFSSLTIGFNRNADPFESSIYIQTLGYFSTD